LSSGVEDLDVTYDQVTELPNFVTSREPAARLSPGGASPRERSPEFIRNQRSRTFRRRHCDHRGRLCRQPRSYAQADATPTGRGARTRARRSSDSWFNISNLKTVNLVQRADGKEVFNSDVTVAVNADNEVLTVSGQPFPARAKAPNGAKRGAIGRGREASSAEEATPGRHSI
jgi:hypothetical protein